MPELSVDFEVFCAGCGAGLCGNCTVGRTRGRQIPCVTIEPCERCIDKANNKGFEEGHDKGWTEAKAEREEVPS